MAAGLFIRHLLRGIQSRWSHPPTYLGHQQLVGLLQFLDEQTIEAIFQLNSVAVAWSSLSHAFVSASVPPATPDWRSRLAIDPSCSRTSGFVVSTLGRASRWRRLWYRRSERVASSAGPAADNDMLDAETHRSPAPSAPPRPADDRTGAAVAGHGWGAGLLRSRWRDPYVTTIQPYMTWGKWRIARIYRYLNVRSNLKLSFAFEE